MSSSAQVAIRAWLNARPIVGDGQLLARGAYLREQRSPADGAYAVLTRTVEQPGGVVAEDGLVSMARLSVAVYAGTEEAAEAAAVAVRNEFEKLTGCPEPCGTTGVTVLAAANHLGPMFLPVAADSGEIYAFQVTADFVLTG